MAKKKKKPTSAKEGKFLKKTLDFIKMGVIFIQPYFKPYLWYWFFTSFQNLCLNFLNDSVTNEFYEKYLKQKCTGQKWRVPSPNFAFFQFFGCLTSFNPSKSKTKDSVGQHFFIAHPPVSSRSPYLPANDEL